VTKDVKCDKQLIAPTIHPQVTDDKNLSKQERKDMQVVKASKCSRDAKLVKLADKLYNCNDLVIYFFNGAPNFF